MTTSSLFKPARLLALALSLTSPARRPRGRRVQRASRSAAQRRQRQRELDCDRRARFVHGGQQPRQRQCKPPPAETPPLGDLTAEGKFLRLDGQPVITVTGPLVGGPQHTTGRWYSAKDQRLTTGTSPSATVGGDTQVVGGLINAGQAASVTTGGAMSLGALPPQAPACCCRRAPR